MNAASTCGMVLGPGEENVAAARGVTQVLSHWMSSVVAAEWRRAEATWREGLSAHVGADFEASLAAGRVDPATAVAASVVGAVVTVSHSGAEVPPRLDVAAALTRAIIMEQCGGDGGGGGGDGGGGGGDGGGDGGGGVGLDLPKRMRYCPAAEPFVIPADDPRLKLRGGVSCSTRSKIIAVVFKTLFVVQSSSSLAH